MQTDFSRFSYSPRIFRDMLSKNQFGACAVTGYCSLTYAVFLVVLWLRIQGHPMGNFEKRPKTNSKAWIKLSEAHLSILGDCWKKFICSSLPASLMEEFPASKVHLHVHPETWLTGKFTRRRISIYYWPVWVWGHKEKFRPSVCWCVGGGWGWVRQWVWQKGAIHPFSGRWGDFLTT